MEPPVKQNEQAPLVQNQQPVPVGIPAVGALPDKTNWSTGFCDCLDDVPSCCEGYFCHYCQYGFQYSVLTENKREMNPMACFGACCGDCLLLGLGTTLGAMFIRNEARQRMNIGGDDLTEFFLGFCCPACSTCQVYREMSIRGAWPSGICVSAPYVHNAPLPPLPPPRLGANVAVAVGQQVPPPQGGYEQSGYEQAGYQQQPQQQPTGPSAQQV